MHPTPTPPADVSSSIRQRRRDAGLSQTALAHAARVSLGSVKAIEGGNVPIRSTVLPRLCGYLGIEDAA